MPDNDPLSIFCSRNYFLRPNVPFRPCFTPQWGLLPEIISDPLSPLQVCKQRKRPGRYPKTRTTARTIKFESLTLLSGVAGVENHQMAIINFCRQYLNFLCSINSPIDPSTQIFHTITWIQLRTCMRVLEVRFRESIRILILDKYNLHSFKKGCICIQGYIKYSF